MGLRVGVGVGVPFGGNDAAIGGALPSVSIGSGPFETGTELTATVNGLEGGETVAWGFQDDGVDIVASEGSGTWPQTITYTAAIGTDSVADASAIRPWVTVNGGNRIYGAARTIVQVAPTNSVAPSVSGTTGLGDTLTAANGTWTATGGAYSYQWKRDGVAISGATSQTYDLVLADSEADISCDVTYTNSGGTLTVASSNAVTAGDYSPTFSAQPQITGTPEVGETLTLVEGTAGPEATLEIITFTLDGVDKIGELSGLDWDTTGENVYGAAGEIALVVRATNAVGTADSNTITETLTDVPDAATVDMFSLADNADGTAELTISSLPGNGGQPSGFKAQYQVNGGTWNDVPSYAGTGDYTLSTDVSAGTLDIALRWVNDVGNGTASATEDVTVTGTAATITIDSLVYARGTAGVDPTVTTSVSSTGTPVGDFTLFWATSASGATISKSNIENGTGDVIESGTIVASTLAGLDDNAVDLNSDVTGGEIHAFIRDANGIESDIAEETSVTYDSVAPAFSSATTNTSGDAITITVTKDTYGSPSLGSFSARKNGVAITLDDLSFTPGTTLLTLSIQAGDEASFGDTLDVTYTGSSLVGIDGETVATFSQQTVTNATTGTTFDVTVLPVVSDDNLSSTPSFSLNLSAYTDPLVGVVYGPLQDVTSATLDGNAMTKVVNTGGASGGRLALLTYQLSGAGGSSVPLNLTLANGSNDHILTIFVVEDGVIQDTAVDSDQNGAAVSGAVTPTRANNVILGICHGKTASSFGSGVAWTNVTEQREATVIARAAGETYGRADDVATSTITVTATPSGGSDDLGLIVIAIQETP